MAQNRYVDTNFWKDTYVIDLDPIEKLMFLYLLTNPRTNIAGIYEISLREIAFDTGIDRDMVQKILDRFKRDKKIYYHRGWLALYNWIKHQALNPKVAEGVLRIVDNLPEWLQHDLLDSEQAELPLLQPEPMHSLSKPIPLYLTKLNSTKPNSTSGKPAGDSKKSKQPLSPQQKRSYARAVRADEQQAERVASGGVRTTSGPVSLGEQFASMRAERDAKKIKEVKK